MTARGARSIIGVAFNIFLICVGLFTLTAGTYASVESIIQGYAAANFGGAFTCATNGLQPAVDLATATPEGLALAAQLGYPTVAKRWLADAGNAYLQTFKLTR